VKRFNVFVAVEVAILIIGLLPLLLELKA